MTYFQSGVLFLEMIKVILEFVNDTFCWSTFLNDLTTWVCTIKTQQYLQTLANYGGCRNELTFFVTLKSCKCISLFACFSSVWTLLFPNDCQTCLPSYFWGPKEGSASCLKVRSSLRSSLSFCFTDTSKGVFQPEFHNLARYKSKQI